MATKDPFRNMKEWLALAGVDSRLAPFDLRSLANQAAVAAANELGANVDEQSEARGYLATYPAVLDAVDRYREASETLARHREQTRPHEDEDRKLDRKRIGTRHELVRSVDAARRG